MANPGLSPHFWRRMRRMRSAQYIIAVSVGSSGPPAKEQRDQWGLRSFITRSIKSEPKIIASVLPATP